MRIHRAALCGLFFIVSASPMVHAAKQLVCINDAGQITVKPKCKASERRMGLSDLVKQGPQGPVGPIGPVGPMGPSGATPGPCATADMNGVWKVHVALRYVEPTNSASHIDGIGTATLSMDSDGKIIPNAFDLTVRENAKNMVFNISSWLLTIDANCAATGTARIGGPRASGYEVTIDGQMDSLGKNFIQGMIYRSPPSYAPSNIYYPFGLISFVKQP